jgi:hypothetical protein
MAQDEIIKNTDPEPTAAGTDTFKIKVNYGSPFPGPGWWLDNGWSGDYSIITSTGEQDGTVWELIVYKGQNYLKAGTNSYLAATSPLKKRGWIFADAWQFEGDRLRCISNNMFVGSTPVGYYYADSQNICSLERVPAKP